MNGYNHRNLRRNHREILGLYFYQTCKHSSQLLLMIAMHALVANPS